jgi:hypothetical protein
MMNLNGTKVNGTELAHHKKILRQLLDLSIGGVRDVRSVIQVLKGSTTLQTLGADKGELNDEDMHTIASITQLHALAVSGNPAVTDKGVAILASMPNLCTVDLEGCSVTPACVESLVKMPRLEKVLLSGKGWTDAEKFNFKLRLHPRVQVHFDGDPEP